MDMKERVDVLNLKRSGDWGQSETEKVLKYLQTKSFGKVTPDIYKDSQTHLQVR